MLEIKFYGKNFADVLTYHVGKGLNQNIKFKPLPTWCVGTSTKVNTHHADKGLIAIFNLNLCRCQHLPRAYPYHA